MQWFWQMTQWTFQRRTCAIWERLHALGSRCGMHLLEKEQLCTSTDSVCTFSLTCHLAQQFAKQLLVHGKLMMSLSPMSSGLVRKMLKRDWSKLRDTLAFPRVSPSQTRGPHHLWQPPAKHSCYSPRAVSYKVFSSAFHLRIKWQKPFQTINPFGWFPDIARTPIVPLKNWSSTFSLS